MARKVIGVKWKSEVCKSSPRNRPVWIPPMSDRFHRTFILSTNTLFIHPFPNPVKALQGSYSPKTKTRRFLSRPSCGLDGSSSPNDFTSRTLKQSEVCSLAAKLTDVGSSSLTEIDKIASGFIFSREMTNRNFKSPSGIVAVNTWRTRPMKFLPSKLFRRQITKAGGFFQNRLPKAARETQSPCQCMLRAATFHRAILRPPSSSERFEKLPPVNHLARPSSLFKLDVSSPFVRQKTGEKRVVLV